MVMKRVIQIVAISVTLCLPGIARADGQYSLIVSATAGGSLQVQASFGNVARAWAGDQALMLDAGTNVTLTATANAGWHFARWIGSMGFNTATLSFALEQDWILQAIFEPDKPTLVVTAGKGGTVALPGLGSFSYDQGARVVVQAQADSGYIFSTWTGTAVDAGRVAEPTSAGTIVQMDKDYTLQANFQLRGLNLNVSAGIGGTVIAPGVGDFSYLRGAVVVISAKANAGYHFVNWTGSAVDALKVADPNSATTMLTMDDNCTVRAIFAGNKHTLVVAWTMGGSVETVTTWNDVRTTLTSQGAFQIDDGATVQMTARADAGWHFTHWSGAPDSANSVLTFTMAEDRNIQAYFAKDGKTIVVSAGEGGTVTQPGVGKYSYERGTVVPLQALANTGYRFVKWTGSVVDSNDVVNRQLSQTSLVVDESGTLQANFELMPQALGERWQVTPTGVFTPSTSTFIGGDEGFWGLRDGFSGSSACGATPQRATILTLENDHALMLTSVNGGKTCSDRISVLLGGSDSPAPWAGVSIDPGTVISFDEVGKLCSAALHAAGKNALLPSYDNISLVLTDNNGNTLVYVLQRYAGATPNLGNTLGDTYREIFLSATAIKYQRNLYYDFLSLPAFRPTGARVQSIEFRVDAHGSAIIDNVVVGPGTVIDKIPVYRFWSPVMQDHFYTASETERQKVSDWVAEGIAYFALPYGSDPNTKPVYRFWSPIFASHFYTISESEKNKLLTTAADAWTFEGVYFYAFPQDRRPADTVPVYRFWSPSLKHHFYTTSQPEKDKVINMNPQLWVDEGIAWYAYAPWAFTPVLEALACSK